MEPIIMYTLETPEGELFLGQLFKTADEAQSLLDSEFWRYARDAGLKVVGVEIKKI